MLDRTAPRCLAALTLLAALAAWPRPARASCAPRTPAQYVKQARHVFLGRAGPVTVKGTSSRQPITVLHVIRGKPGRVFTRVRKAGVTIPNDRVIEKGEVALFFVNKGQIHLCSGNFPLALQMRHMATYLALGRGKAGEVGQAAIQRVVRALLLPYLHDRARIPVTFKPLAGKRFRQWKSELVFVGARRKDAIEIEAQRRGKLILVSGVYHLEGFHFHALLMSRGKGKLELLYRAGWEQ